MRTQVAWAFLFLLLNLWVLPASAYAAQEPAREAGELSIEERILKSADGTEIAAEFGRLVVPEVRGKDGSNLIELAFVRLKSKAESPLAPLIYLAGGPGGSSTFFADRPASLQAWLPMLGLGDVIFLDQRATGRSEPDLRFRSPSPPPLEVFADQEVAKEYFLEGVRGAAEYYREQGIDFDGYNSAESADDINDLRIALGLEKVSLFGFSYGTHLALATIRRHGEHLENVIAIGVEGLHQTHKLPLNMDTQFRKLSLLVARDSAVGPYVPDMDALLERVIERLDREPMMVEIEDRARGTLTVPVSGAGLRFILRRDIGDASDLPVFPKLLYSIDQGDPSILRWFVQKRWPSGGSNLMTVLMDGASGASPERWAVIRAQNERSMFGDVVNFPWPDVDEATGVRNLGEDYRAPLVSEVRTLFLTGSLDFNTPPYQAEEIRWGMPNATHIVVENAGHEQILPQRETQQVIMRFLQGEDVRDVTIALPPLRFVPIEGSDPRVSHPSVRG